MIRFAIREAFNRGGYNIWIVRTDGNSYKVGMPNEIKFSESYPDSSFELPEPTFFIRNIDWESLKSSLSAELIANGLAKDPERLIGELAATKIHLGDLRDLIFKDNLWSKGNK